MITFHSATTCLETYYKRTTSISTPNSAGPYTDTGITEFKKEYGLSYFSSSSQEGDEGGSYPQTYYWADPGTGPGFFRAAQTTIATTFKQAWATTSSLSSQSASQTSYTSFTQRSRGEGTRESYGTRFTNIITVTYVGSLPATSDEGSTTTTYPLIAAGKTSVSSASYTFSAPATQTYSFSQLFWSLPGSVFSNPLLSGTASGTRTTSGSRQLTASGPFTVHFFGPPGVWAQVLRVGRQPLPPTRHVGPAFVLTATSADLNAVASTLSGTVTQAAGFYNYLVESTTSSSSRAVQEGYGGSSTRATTSSQGKFTITQFSSTGVNLGISASRRGFANGQDVFATFNSASQSFYNSISMSPSEMTSWPSFYATVFNAEGVSVRTPLVYTTIRQSLSADGSSASAQWIYTSGDWRLRITKSNSSTSSTMLATIGFSQSASTTSRNATGAVVTGNNVTAVLGPGFPVAVSSMNLLSVTQGGGSTVYGISYPQGTKTLSSSSFSTGSFTTETLFGSASGWTIASFANSQISAYKNIPAVSLSTSSITSALTNTNSILVVNFLPTFGNKKLNEAGRTDPASVLE